MFHVYLLSACFYVIVRFVLPLQLSKVWRGLLGFVRKVVVAKIAAMTGWRPVWQGVTNFLMRHGR